MPSWLDRCLCSCLAPPPAPLGSHRRVPDSIKLKRRDSIESRWLAARAAAAEEEANNHAQRIDEWRKQRLSELGPSLDRQGSFRKSAEYFATTAPLTTSTTAERRLSELGPSLDRSSSFRKSAEYFASVSATPEPAPVTRRHSAVAAEHADDPEFVLALQMARKAARAKLSDKIDAERTTIGPGSSGSAAAAAELSSRGVVANRDGLTREALALFSRAHQLMPLEPRYLLSAANMHLKLGEAAAAHAKYEQLALEHTSASASASSSPSPPSFSGGLSSRAQTMLRENKAKALAMMQSGDGGGAAPAAAAASDATAGGGGAATDPTVVQTRMPHPPRVPGGALPRGSLQ